MASRVRLSIGLALIGFCCLRPFLNRAVQAQTADAFGEVAAAPELKAPVPFKSKEGKKGWKVIIPGNRPLATPAVVDGKIYLGGGFGSHEFYALDAVTGKKAWVYRTGDDGPTAAVVDGGYIAFNTESCELEILTLEGKRLWKKRLGDPLMSMPAMSKGKVYMAYPDEKKAEGNFLACFDVKSGELQWKAPIAAEIITAPTLAGDRVYVATLDGTLACFDAAGKLCWSEKTNVTSSATVWNDTLYVSRREEKTVKDDKGKEVKQQAEAIATRGLEKKGGVVSLKETRHDADYLDMAKRSAPSTHEKALMGLDAGVGFGNAGNIGGGLNIGGFAPGGPGVAKMTGGYNLGNLGGAGSFNTGQLTVAGVWSYQGSRPFAYNNRIYSSMGDRVLCVEPAGKTVWKSRPISAAKDKKPVVDAHLTPPVLVNGKVFVGTTKGVLLCLDADNGKELWRATLGEPILFQPAVVAGRVYVPTNRGSLFCVETGDREDDGWHM